MKAITFILLLLVSVAHSEQYSFVPLSNGEVSTQSGIDFMSAPLIADLYPDVNHLGMRCCF